MGTRYFALIFGIVYTLIGLMGLIPGLLTGPTTPLAVDILHGNLLGIFPVNIIHTLVHLIFGIWGILAYRSFDSARVFSRTAGVTFILLAIFGLIPGLNTLFGLAPLHGSDVWLHLVSGVVALYFGLTARTPVEAAAPPNPPVV
ncbi:MAG: DUF4383 domain-containing protein [Chloroflexi bacterium]|nr:MAG: DUF4383 domain-containing protein [Chloroflexota bacterium]